MRSVFRKKNFAMLVRAALVALSLTSFAASAAQRNPLSKKVPGTEFFSEPSIRTFHFEISDAASNQLRRAPRTYVTGTIREGDRVLTNVAIRLKGMGSFRTVDEKPSFAVKFDEFATDQHYRGLSKLMFNNSVQDSTYLDELLATQLFRDAGLPAARGTHARVTLNGRDLGLYVVFEAMNQQFLKQHFKDAKGNLYEAYLGDIDSRMEHDSGSDASMDDLRKLNATCSISDPAKRWEELNKVLDADRFISFVAMEMLTSHWDGYTIHTNNYRIYHDPATDRFTFITHGVDWAFRRPNISVYPPPKSIVGRAVLNTPEGQRLYRERIGTLFTNVFRVPVITNRMEQALAKIRGAGLGAPATEFRLSIITNRTEHGPVIIRCAGPGASELANIEQRAGLLRERIERRAARVADQLRGVPPEPMKFDAKGFAYPVEWRDEPDRGDALFEFGSIDGHHTLHIGARNERTRASWRSQVYLARGWYRFEGMARTDGLNGGSARLRISGDTRSVGIAGSNAGWRPLTHDFEVTDAGMDVELVCELTTLQGGVWFNVDSLRVRKISAAEAQALNLRRTVFGE